MSDCFFGGRIFKICFWNEIKRFGYNINIKKIFYFFLNSKFNSKQPKHVQGEKKKEENTFIILGYYLYKRLVFGLF